MRHLISLIVLSSILLSGPEDDAKALANKATNEANHFKENGIHTVTIPKSENPEEVHLNNDDVLRQKQMEKRENDPLYQKFDQLNKDLKVESVHVNNPNEGKDGKVIKRTVTGTTEETCFDSGDGDTLLYTQDLRIRYKLIPEISETIFYCDVDHPKTRKVKRKVKVKTGKKIWRWRGFHSWWVPEEKEKEVEVDEAYTEHCSPGCKSRVEIRRPKEIIKTIEDWVGNDGLSDIEPVQHQLDVDMDYKEYGEETRNLDAVSDPDQNGAVQKEIVPTTRPCWRKEYTYKIYPKPCYDCEQLKHHCRQIRAQCVESFSLNNERSICLKWKKTFACDSYKDEEEAFSLEGSLKTTRPVETINKNMYEGLSKLEALKQMEENQTLTGTTTTVFKGDGKRCKQIFGGSFNNCCRRGGWIIDIGLSRDCDTEEKTLGKMREQDRCVFVGEHIDRRDLWLAKIDLSRSERYCCFDTPLAKAIQVGARSQLGIGWGSYHHPDCRGLTPEELERVDFSKIDLSSSFKDISKSAGKMATDMANSLRQTQEILKQPKTEDDLKKERNDKFDVDEMLQNVKSRKENHERVSHEHRNVKKEQQRQGDAS